MRRPIIRTDASVPQSTSRCSDISVSAAHEVGMSFVRSGQVFLPGADNTTFRAAGNIGYSWPSRVSSSTTLAYNLKLDVNTFDPSDDSPRYASFPLRCLSTVLVHIKLSQANVILRKIGS